MICYNCGNEISTEGANCPFCGAPLNTASGQPNPGPYQQAGPQQGQPVQPGPQPNFQQGQPGQQEMTGGGVKAYIRSSFVRLILVTAFAVFMLSGVYIHVGYAIGNGFTQAMRNI